MSRAPDDDRTIGTFSDHGPWNLIERPPTWLDTSGARRAASRARVPELTAPRRLPPTRRLGRTLIGLGRAVGPWWVKEKGTHESRAGISRRMREAMEALGPTYIKLAQIISAGEGLFPDELVREFSLCRDRARAEPFDKVRLVVESDLARPLQEVFASFDPQPVAAASIAQVHEVVLADGTPAVVKVQRPGIDRLVESDLAVLAWLAPLMIGRIPVTALANPPALVDLFAETIVEELDFRLEAENLLDVARVLAELDQRDWVLPRPHPELVTRRVLVMERVGGFRFDDVAGMKGAGIDTHRIVRNVMIAFLEATMLHGVFHGDFHGGNLFVQPDGRIALLDFGITGRLDAAKRQAFLRLMVAGTTNDVRTQMAALRDLGALPADVDIDAVISDLGLDQPTIDPTRLSADELMAEMQRIVKSLMGYGARLPKELMLFVKNLVYLSTMIDRLAPGVDLLAEVQHIAMHFALAHGDRIMADAGQSLDPADIDLSSVRASLGVEDTVEAITYSELKARRETILKRMREHRD